MNRVLTVLLIFLAGAVAALAVLGYFAYVIDAGPPRESSVQGLDDVAIVGFSDQETARISASSLRDAMTGLGYAQAATRTWPLVVYRAAATGRMHTLVGSAGLEVDRRALQLGLASDAQKAYSLLPDEDRLLLDAFAAGINAALSDRSVQRDPSLVLSGHVPEAWLPWHSLAVERLFAWIAADPENGSTTTAPSRPIRDFLRIHDLDQSLIVTSESPAEPGLFVRYILGSSALPALFESSLSAGGVPGVRGACLIGTPFFVAGRSSTRAWAFLPAQTYSHWILPVDSLALITAREVLRLGDGSEHLITTRLWEASTMLGDIETRETGRQGQFVSWRGQGAVSDAAAWLGLLRGELPDFRLAAGEGAILPRDGNPAYRPDTGTRLVAGRLVGSSRFLPYVARRLDSLMAGSPGFNPRLWFADAFSPWAAEWTPRLRAMLAKVSAPGATLQDAASYLRNWDHRFDAASIGASIFQTWADEYRVLYGSWPGLPENESGRTAADSIAATADLGTPFLRAVDRLAGRYGLDLSLWRWEEVNGSDLYFPILGRPDISPARTELARYGSRTVPGSGHPTTPNWSPIAPEDERKAAATWEGWTRLTVPGEWSVRRWYPDVAHGVGSRRGPDEGSTVLSLDAAVTSQTRLVPVGAASRPQTSDSGG